MKRTCIILVVAASPLYMSAVMGQELHKVSDIRGDDAGKRAAAVTELTRTRRDVISQLLGIVSDAELRRANPEAVASAIRLLGEYRAEEALQVLPSLLSFEPRVDVDGLHPPRMRYPAMAAMIQIGGPSVAVLMDRVAAGTLSEHQEKSAVWTIIETILGSDTVFMRR